MRPGFKFPPLEPACSGSEDAPVLNPNVLLPQTQRLIAEGEKFLAALRDFQEVLEGRPRPEKVAIWAIVTTTFKTSSFPARSGG